MAAMYYGVKCWNTFPPQFAFIFIVTLHVRITALVGMHVSSNVYGLTFWLERICQIQRSDW